VTVTKPSRHARRVLHPGLPSGRHRGPDRSERPGGAHGGVLNAAPGCRSVWYRPRHQPQALPGQDGRGPSVSRRSPTQAFGGVRKAAEGLGTNEIVRETGLSKPMVISWKRRHVAGGLGGLEDRPKPDETRTTDDVVVVLRTLEPPPERLGVTHLSSRLLTAELGLSNVTVAKVWRESMGCSPGGPRRSSSPPTHSWRPRSATWWACTSTRPTRPSFCVPNENPGPGAGTGRAVAADGVPPENSIVSLTCLFLQRGWRGDGWLTRCCSRSSAC
jgi:hypothetical protein